MKEKQVNVTKSHTIIYEGKNWDDSLPRVLKSVALAAISYILSADAVAAAKAITPARVNPLMKSIVVVCLATMLLL